MNRNIILAIIAVVLIALAAFLVFSQPSTTDGKINTEITFLNDATLQNGDVITFELKDASGKAIAGQNLTIAYDAGTGTVEDYKVITDSDGRGYLALKDEAAGTYDVAVTYDGNDQYNGCSAKLSVTIEEGASDEAAEETESNATASTVLYHEDTADSDSSQASSSEAHQTYYDPELNLYYDENGIVIGGQEAGASIYEIRNRPPMQEEGT